jgi:hypothetical protein
VGKRQSGQTEEIEAKNRTDKLNEEKGKLKPKDNNRKSPSEFHK